MIRPPSQIIWQNIFFCMGNVPSELSLFYVKFFIFVYLIKSTNKEERIAKLGSHVLHIFFFALTISFDRFFFSFFFNKRMKCYFCYKRVLILESLIFLNFLLLGEEVSDFLIFFKQTYFCLLFYMKMYIFCTWPHMRNLIFLESISQIPMNLKKKQTK